MKVPENFRTRIAGNIYENTPDLVVCNKAKGEIYRDLDQALVL